MKEIKLTPLQLVQAAELCDGLGGCDHCPMVSLLGKGCIAEREKQTLDALRASLIAAETAELAEWRAGFHD